MRRGAAGSGDADPRRCEPGVIGALSLDIQIHGLRCDHAEGLSIQPRNYAGEHGLNIVYEVPSFQFLHEAFSKCQGLIDEKRMHVKVQVHEIGSEAREIRKAVVILSG